jgi:hypothetical protein
MKRMSMKRTTVFIAPKHLALLEKAGEELSLYPAQVIRLALSEYFARRAKK